MSVRKISTGDVVYVMLSPNNSIQEYRCAKCIVKTIYYRGSSQRESVEWDTDNIPLEYRLCLKNFDNEKVIYTRKHLDKIYLEDELNSMAEDIINLNKLLAFKKQQREELKKYIKNEFPKWKYRSKINGI